MADLAGLIERAEKLTGPDRETDYDIMAALFSWAQRGLPWMREYPGEEPIYMHDDGSYRKRPAPSLTASLDAVTALIERVLPGHPNSNGMSEGGNFFAYIWRSEAGDLREGMGFADTRALACCLALLRFLQSKPEGDRG